MLRAVSIVALATALAADAAFGQSVILQGGPTSPGHLPMYVGSGHQQPIVQDGGGSGGGAIGANPGEIGITSRSPINSYPSANSGNGPLGEHLCMFDAPTTNPTGYHYLCFDPNAQGGGLVDYGYGGGATPLPLTISANGVSQTFPFTAPVTPVAGVPVYDPRNFGAKCDGSTDDYAAFSAAETQAQIVGGVVLLPATGHSCVISHGLTLANGVVLEGVANSNFEGATQPVSGWTQFGSWLQSTDTTNPTVTLYGHGSGVRDVNFIRAQPIPSSTPGTTYTPTTYPFELVVSGDFQTVSNVKMIAAYNGLSIAYNSTASGGGATHIDHVMVDAMNISYQTLNVNDVVYGSDWHARSWFYSSNSNLVAYRESNAVDWDMHYTDNIQVDGFECFQSAVCIKATNGTVQSNTHAGYNIRLDNVLCGQVVQCIVAPAGTVLTGHIGSLTGQQDNNLSNLFVDISTDGVDLSIANMLIPTVGGQLVSLGAGTSGRLKIANLALGSNAAGTPIYGYSAVATGQVAFGIAANARLSIANRSVIRATSAGSFYGGAGADNVQTPTYCWQPFSTFGQVTITGSGTNQTFTTDNYQNTNRYGTFVQVRIQGQPNVTATTAGTAYFSAANFALATDGTTAITCSVNTAVSGFQACDSNWKDVADSGQAVGRLEENMPVGATATFGDLTFCGR